MQFTKVGIALVDKPCQCAKVQPNSVNPILFKSVAGNGHPEFSSGRQQVRRELFLVWFTPGKEFAMPYYFVFEYQTFERI